MIFQNHNRRLAMRTLKYLFKYFNKTGKIKDWVLQAEKDFTI